MLRDIFMVVTLSTGVAVSAQETSTVCPPIDPIFPQSKVSESAIRHLFKLISGNPAYACRNFAAAKIRRCSSSPLNSATLIWDFTLPGHPAHSAVTRIRWGTNINCLSRDFYFSGNAQAAAAWIEKERAGDYGLSQIPVIP